MSIKSWVEDVGLEVCDFVVLEPLFGIDSLGRLVLIFEDIVKLWRAARLTTKQVDTIVTSQYRRTENLDIKK